MPNKFDLLLLNGLALGAALLILLGGCGILTGNPEDERNGSPSGTSDPADDYQSAQNTPQTDCGSFTEQSPPADVEAGRDCIRNACTESREAFYLYEETTAEGKQFSSFIQIKTSCAVTVHAVSTDPNRFIGDETKSCSELTEPIEMSCGIGT